MNCAICCICWCTRNLWNLRSCSIKDLRARSISCLTLIHVLLSILMFFSKWRYFSYLCKTLIGVVVWWWQEWLLFHYKYVLLSNILTFLLGLISFSFYRCLVLTFALFLYRFRFFYLRNIFLFIFFFFFYRHDFFLICHLFHHGFAWIKGLFIVIHFKY